MRSLHYMTACVSCLWRSHSREAPASRRRCRRWGRMVRWASGWRQRRGWWTQVVCRYYSELLRGEELRLLEDCLLAGSHARRSHRAHLLDLQPAQSLCLVVRTFGYFAPLSLRPTERLQLPHPCGAAPMPRARRVSALG